MKTPFKILLPFFIVSMTTGTALKAQKGDNLVKLGSNVFALSDGQRINHTFASLGASFEHLFSQQFSASLNISAARLLNRFSAENAYIKNISSLETEVRFYPNNKGKGFYAGASLALYQDKTVSGLVSDISMHLGSHINFGVQIPVGKAFYLQANSQIGVYGKGYSTISRYGLNVMLGLRL
jgi:hypothetical protein